MQCALHEISRNSNPEGTYTQYGPIKNGRIKNQHSDFEKNKEPENSGLEEQIYHLRTSQH